eukprot:364810-Chlamydomonas_euryale.AAC.21
MPVQACCCSTLTIPVLCPTKQQFDQSAECWAATTRPGKGAGRFQVKEAPHSSLWEEPSASAFQVKEALCRNEDPLRRAEMTP